MTSCIDVAVVKNAVIGSPLMNFVKTVGIRTPPTAVEVKPTTSVSHAAEELIVVDSDGAPLERRGWLSLFFASLEREGSSLVSGSFRLSWPLVIGVAVVLIILGGKC